jgi:hypothetical protein
MYNDLSEEELILLAIEYVLKGVSIPSGIADRLGSEVIETIKENT